MELNYLVITIVAFAAIVLLVLLGMRIAFALMTVGVVALFFFMPKPMLGSTAASAWSQLNSFTLTATTLFILMGEILMRGGLGEELYGVMEKWFNRLPGGLAQVNVAACALFASISGSSIATAATMGTIAVPAMEKRGYDKKLTFGSLAAGGTLGILIPPSVIMVIYGAMAETSVGKLFMAGVVPGILLAVLFMVLIGVWAVRSPGIAPRSAEGVPWRVRLGALAHLLPTLILIVAILGGIYGGVMTPTEAAAVGAVLSAVIVAVRKKFTWALIKNAAVETAYMTAMLNIIVAGAAMVAFMFQYLQIPAQLTNAIVGIGMSPYLVYLSICVMYLILGCFIDGISMVLITIPVIVPLMDSLGFDRVWLGIVLTVCVELALITPPVGMNLFVLQGIGGRNTPMHEVALGASPFVGVMCVMLIILAAFPPIALWLPGTMAGT